MAIQKIKVTLVRSLSGRIGSHKCCAKGLGLSSRMNCSVVVDGTPENLGMINKISYLLKVEEV